MGSINKVTVLGYVGDEPKIQTFDSGAKKATVNLATKEVYKDKNGEKVEKTTWHYCVAWKHNAELIQKWVKKGDQVLFEGKNDGESYEKDGKTVYSKFISITSICLLSGSMKDGKGKGNSNGNGNNNNEEGLPF